MNQCINLGVFLAYGGAIMFGLAVLTAIAVAIWFIRTKRLKVVDAPAAVAKPAKPAAPAKPVEKNGQSPMIWWVASTVMFAGLVALAMYIFLSA